MGGVSGETPGEVAVKRAGCPGVAGVGLWLSRVSGGPSRSLNYLHPFEPPTPSTDRSGSARIPACPHGLSIAMRPAVWGTH